MRTPAELLDPSCPIEILREAATSNQPSILWAVAQNPNTPLELLQKLAKSANLQTQHHVARNPNITIELLMSLLQRDPLAIQENPSVALWLLEDPSFAQRFSYDIVAELLNIKDLNPAIVRAVLPSCYRHYQNLIALLKHPNAPFDLFPELLHQSKVHRNARALYAARNPNLPTSLVHFLLGNKIESTRKLVSQHKNIDPNFLALAKRLGWSHEYNQAPSDPNLTRDDLVTLSVGGPYLRALIAKHPSADDSVFALIAVGVDDPILRYIAVHPNTRIDALKGLIERKGHIFTTQIALRNDLTPEILLLLSQHGGARTLMVLLRKPTLPAECFAAFVKSRTIPVRAEAAKHPDLPEALAQRLSRDHAERVRLSLTKRKSLSSELFRLLSRDRSVHVREAISQRSDAPVQAHSAPRIDPAAELLSLFDAFPLDEKRRLAALPGVHPRLQRHLSSEPQNLPIPPAPLTREERAERLKLIQSINVSDSIFEGLMPHDEPLLRRAMLRHERAPLVLLVSAALSGKTGELVAMRRNPSLHPAIREWLTKSSKLVMMPR